MDTKGKVSNGKRLIDANAFLKDILTAGIGKTIIEYSESDIGYMIRKRPTVDAVEVVRCKDCKHYTPYVDYYDGKTYNQGVCKHYNQILFDNNFCSFGVRKDEENGRVYRPGEGSPTYS